MVLSCLCCFTHLLQAIFVFSMPVCMWGALLMRGWQVPLDPVDRQDIGISVLIRPDAVRSQLHPGSGTAWLIEVGKFICVPDISCTSPRTELMRCAAVVVRTEAVSRW